MPKKLNIYPSFSLQDLIDKAKKLLVGNRTMLHKLQASTGVPVTGDKDDDAYESFNQVLIVSFQNKSDLLLGGSGSIVLVHSL